MDWSEYKIRPADIEMDGIEVAGELFDTMLAHYVIEPDGKRSMDELSQKFLGYEPVSIEELIGKKGKSQGTMRDVEIEKIKEYAGEDADITLQLLHGEKTACRSEIILGSEVIHF